MTDGRMRLTVLGGFLGSGKTTWLRHQLHRGLFSDAVVIVNEAAETPVDDALLAGASRLVVLAGGCACCTGKPQLIEMLRGLCDERSRTASDRGRLDRIVLETSGLADPAPIIEAIRTDPVLVHHIVVGEIVVAVDALHALSQLVTEPLGRAQVEVADQLIVTKIDEAEEGELARLLATLRLVNPGATISGAIKGSDAPLPQFADAVAEILPATSDSRVREPIFPTRIVLDQAVDWTAFSVWLSALLHARGNDVMRVKGVVQTPAGRLLLQSVRRTVQSPEILPDQSDGREDDTLVVIGRGYTQDQLVKSLRYFAG